METNTNTPRTLGPHAGAEDLLRLAWDWQRAGEGVAIATVIGTWGSSPRPAGSRLVLTRDGAMAGSVSGGCIESEVAEAAAEVLDDGVPRLLTFDVGEERAWSVGLACGGKVQVFVEALGPAAG